MIDISDPARPQQVGEFDTSGFLSVAGLWFQHIAVSGPYAYLAHGGLQVIDISAPENSRRVGGYNKHGRAQDVTVSGNLIYVADRTWGLRIFEQSRALRLQVSGNPPFGFFPASKSPGFSLCQWTETSSAPGRNRLHQIGTLPRQFPCSRWRRDGDDDA